MSKSITFNADMIKALLAGNKTQTRRPIANQDEMYISSMGAFKPNNSLGKYIGGRHHVPCPLGKSGDTLWVRETFQLGLCTESSIAYRATHNPSDLEEGQDETIKWQPSIHMPQWASRITLKITDIRIEKLQDISDDDAFKEGVKCIHGDRCNSMSCEWGCTPAPFKENVWDKIYHDKHKPGFAWDKNPWVWVIGFKLQKRGLNT